MDKQAQDKLWNDLSEEDRQYYIDYYNCPMNSSQNLLERIFGSHNLNPKPPTPKTWKDVVKERKYCGHLISKTGCRDNESGECPSIVYDSNFFSEKIINKVIATMKIAYLIEHYYGGMVSEEEWKKSASYDKEDALWTIVCECKKEYQEPQFRIAWNCEQVDFLSFHSKELAEEFMSHESNRQLVKQYYLM